MESASRSATGFSPNLVLGLALLAVAGLVGIGFSDKLSMSNARPKAAKANVDLLDHAINVFQINAGKLPTSLDDLLARPSDARTAKNWSGPYLKDANSLTDSWENPIQFKAPGTHNKDGFDVWSFGPDGLDGTSDDIGNWADGR